MRSKFYSFMIFFAILGNSQIVINEVYGTGGSTSSLYKNNFVELKNIGNNIVSQDLFIWTWVGGNAPSSAQGKWLQTVTLNPNQTYLIQLECNLGCNGGNLSLPTPNNSSSIIVKGYNYNVAITDNSNKPNGVNIVDRVGIGLNSNYEGSGPAPTNYSGDLSITRNGSDTNNNSVDFTVQTPSPQNSQGQTLFVDDPYIIKNYFIYSSIDNLLFFKQNLVYEIINSTGQIINKGIGRKDTKISLEILTKGIYYVKVQSNNQTIIAKILK